MTYLAEILIDAGFQNVKTYIQSGNVILETALSKEETAKQIHDTIAEKIGADLKVILKELGQLQTAVQENPFQEGYDFSRVHLVFTNEIIDRTRLEKLRRTDFGDEEFSVGSECFYMYLPRHAEKKRLSTNYLEKQLSITMTMRKINVIEHLVALCQE